MSASPENNTYRVELLPQHKNGKTMCVQGCSRCSSSIMPEEYVDANPKFTPDSLAALSRIETYLHQRGHEIQEFLMTGVPQFKQASLSPLPLKYMPKGMSVVLGKLPETDDFTEYIVEIREQLQILLQGIATETPKAFCLAIFPNAEIESGLCENPAEIILFFRQALHAILHGFFFNTHVEHFFLSQDINNMNQGTYAKIREHEGLEKLAELSLIGSKTIDAYSVHSHEKAMSTRMNTYALAQEVTFEFGSNPKKVSFISQYIEKGETKAIMNISTMREEPFLLSLQADHVWIGHSANNIGDHSLRIPYATFFRVIDRCERDGTDLREALFEYIQHQRTLKSRARTAY